jgi:hypothetical protein
VGVGFEPPPSLDEFGSVPEESDLAAWIAARLVRFPHLRYVDISQTRIGAADDRRIGETGSLRDRITNPHYRDSAR